MRIRKGLAVLWMLEVQVLLGVRVTKCSRLALQPLLHRRRAAAPEKRRLQVLRKRPEMFADGFAFALSSLFFTKIRQIIFNLSVREERCFVNCIFTLQRRTISTKIVHMRQKRLKKKLSDMRDNA